MWFCPFKEKTSHKESGNVFTPRRESGHLQPCCEWSGNQTRAVGGWDHLTSPSGVSRSCLKKKKSDVFEGDYLISILKKKKFPEASQNSR